MTCAAEGRPHRVLFTTAVCALIGALGAAVLYYGIFFVMALVNYFDSFYKHADFYALYPTALSYLLAFFSEGTPKHLPGYEIEWNVGIPLAFFCGMTFFGAFGALLLRKTGFRIADGRIVGRAAFGKQLDVPSDRLRAVQPCLPHGITLKTDDGRFVFPLIRRRRAVLDALCACSTPDGVAR